MCDPVSTAPALLESIENVRQANLCSWQPEWPKTLPPPLTIFDIDNGVPTLSVTTGTLHVEFWTANDEVFDSMDEHVVSPSGLQASPWRAVDDDTCDQACEWGRAAVQRMEAAMYGIVQRTLSQPGVRDAVNSLAEPPTDAQLSDETPRL